jgi:hypothetical protein
MYFAGACLYIKTSLRYVLGQIALLFYGMTALSGSGSHCRGFTITLKTHTNSVGLLWMSDQLVAQTSTWPHTTLPAGFEPPILVSEKPQTDALNRVATAFGLQFCIIFWRLCTLLGKGSPSDHYSYVLYKVSTRHWFPSIQQNKHHKIDNCSNVTAVSTSNLRWCSSVRRRVVSACNYLQGLWVQRAGTLHTLWNT